MNDNKGTCNSSIVLGVKKQRMSLIASKIAASIAQRKTAANITALRH